MRKNFLIPLIVFVASAAGAAAQPPAQHPAEQYGFGFINFGTPTLSWDIYRYSFFGIPGDTAELRTTLTSPFDMALYDLVFRASLAKDGNCFGISLMSLMMNEYGGYLGFCCPPSLYGGDRYGGGGPSDSRLRRAINIMHGRQISLAAIRSYLEQFRDGHSFDGSNAVRLAQETIAHEGACLVSITMGLSPQSGGHTMIAYRVTEEPPASGNYRIWVVDPNRLWQDTAERARGWYTGVRGGAPQNFIQIRRTLPHSTWQFRMAGRRADWPTDSEMVAGRPLGSGNLTILPRSLVGPPGRSPSSMGIGILELAGIILVSSNDGHGATIDQVTTPAGRRFLDPATHAIDWDTATGIGTMVPWFPASAGPGERFPFETCFNIAPMPDASVAFTGGSNGTVLVIGNNTDYIRLTSDSPDLRATLHCRGLGSATPDVSIENAGGAARFDIEIVHSVVAGETVRHYFVSGVAAAAKSSEALRVSVDEQEGMSVAGAATASATMRYAQESMRADRRFQSAPVDVVPAAGRHVERAAWQQLDGSPGR